jgi:hypothetical protein
MTKLYDKRLTDTIDFIETRVKLPRSASHPEDAADVCREWLRAAPRALQQVGELIAQGWTAQTIARSAKAVRGAGFPDRLDSAVEVFLDDGWHLFTQFNAANGSISSTRIFPGTCRNGWGCADG